MQKFTRNFWSLKAHGIELKQTNRLTLLLGILVISGITHLKHEQSWWYHFIIDNLHYSNRGI
jgi:hypothetical protein